MPQNETSTRHPMEPPTESSERQLIERSLNLADARPESYVNPSAQSFEDPEPTRIAHLTLSKRAITSITWLWRFGWMLLFAFMPGKYSHQ